MPVPYAAAAANSWQMCSMLEGQDRQDHMELSELESTVETYSLAPKQRKADPKLCVKKYRRSAAGGGSAFSEQLKHQSKVRSVIDLVTTMDHLLNCVLATQKTHTCMKPFPFCKVVHFVDDRIRAVQVDYVTHYYYNNNKTAIVLSEELTMSIIRMQCSILNYHLLVGYLLTEMPSHKFEPKFNVQAMRTSFAHATENLQRYVESDHRQVHREEALSLLDEVMCYESLLHLCAVIVEEASSTITNESFTSRPWMFIDQGPSLTSIESLIRPSLFRKLIISDQPLSSLFPKWTWSLRLTAAYANGNYVQLLRLFSSGQSNCMDTGKTINSSYNNRQEDIIQIGMKQLSVSQNEPLNAWITRCKFCIAPALSIIRINAIQQWNSAFMKSERVNSSDLAELLCFSSSKEAQSFCRLLLLPTETNERGEEMVLFKTGANNSNLSPSLVCCRQDEFVFGGSYNYKDCFSVDADDVWVPSSKLIRFLIFSSNTFNSS